MRQGESQLLAVLIGIESYRSKPLHGCANDIDAVQRLLIERAGVPAENIQRLVSRHGQPPGEVPAGERPATLANIRSVLRMLALQVQEGDRVFIYYSGHGTRVPLAQPGGYTLWREALVPADTDAESPRRLLFDHEFNAILARIAKRTRSVTCILDCCHSGGVTRSLEEEHARPRSMDATELGWVPTPVAPEPIAPPPLPTPYVPTPPVPAPPTAPDSGAPPAVAAGPAEPEPEPEPLEDGPVVRPYGDCHVVMACLDFELAMETTEGGVAHGVLTRAFLGALESIPDHELRTVAWGRIWQAMRAEVERRNPGQHLWMAGNLARAVLAGPPADVDPGLSIRHAGGREYEIDAGTLSSVSESALIAVYDEQPPRLPRPGSAEERRARRGLLRVTSAEPGRARAVLEGPPFALPPGARGRVVQPGRPDRLRCAIVPWNEDIAAALRPSSLIELVDQAQARARLHQVPGRWLLADDLHAETEATALFALRPHELGYVREVVEQYYHYALPLRMAERAQDLPGLLELEVLACEDPLAPDAAQEPDLPLAPTRARSAYELTNGARVCFRVRNASYVQLRVALLNSAASGRVQVLGDAVIDARGVSVFWAQGVLGSPFAMTLPPGKPQGIDRLIAVGTTVMTKDLGYLRVDRRFADIMARGPVRSTFKEVDTGPPLEQWTATQVIVTTRAG